jgi:thiamine pyrophosphate-dependent acetolactate synthase large subunit-like protein
VLDRREALARLLGDASGHLVVTGLGNAANDMAHLTDQGDHVFTMDGAMGAAASVGLGLALAQPERRVAVVTGDGELLMNVGTLATIALQAPANLAVICLDNGVYGLTGGQATHTAHGTDLAGMAAAAGFRHVLTIDRDEDLPAAEKLLAAGELAFLLLKVEPGNTAYPGLDRNGESLRLRFRRGLADDPTLN